MNLTELFNMGGYGIYVWPTYFITLFVFGLNVFLAAREKNHIIKMIKQHHEH